MSIKSQLHENKKSPSENSLSHSQFTSLPFQIGIKILHSRKTLVKKSDIVILMTPPSPISYCIVFLMTPPPLKRSDLFYGRPLRGFLVKTFNNRRQHTIPYDKWQIYWDTLDFTEPEQVPSSQIWREISPFHSPVANRAFKSPINHVSLPP